MREVFSRRFCTLSLVLLLLCVTVSPIPGLAATASIVKVTDRENGNTVRLRRSQRLLVVLSSTYWQIQRSSHRAVLRLVSGPSVRPTMGCVPGAGCGTATATFLAAAAGHATVVATRTSCGEAMGCTPAQSRFILNVVVR